MRKDRILAIARGTLGEAWAQAEAKQKKAEIARAMQEAFAHGDGVPAGVTAEGRAAAIAWTPPGFRAFDTGTVDDEGAASDERTTALEPQPAVADTPLGDAPEDDGDDADGGADPSGADSDTSQSGDPEAGAPADNVADPAPAEAQQPMNAGVQSVVESIDAPAVADRRAAALASAVNADAIPPVAASAPEAAGAGDHDAMRITIAGGGNNVPVEPEQVMAPPRGNGHDNKAELLEIPAFLRRG